MNPNFWPEFWAHLAERWPLYVLQFCIALAIFLPPALREQKRRNRRK